MAGGAADGIDLLLAQTERQAQAEGMSPQQVTQVVTEQRQIFELVLAEKWDELKVVVTDITLKRLQALPPESTAALGDLNTFADQRAAQSVATFQHPRYQYLLGHDFGEDWTRVSAPVLAMFGELDVQCDADLNKNAIEQILAQSGNDDVTTVVIPQANHLFLKAQTGAMTEYTTLPKDFAPGVLQTISDWLGDRVGGNE